MRIDDLTIGLELYGLSEQDPTEKSSATNSGNAQFFQNIENFLYFWLFPNEAVYQSHLKKSLVDPQSIEVYQRIQELLGHYLESFSKKLLATFPAPEAKSVKKETPPENPSNNNLSEQAYYYTKDGKSYYRYYYHSVEKGTLFHTYQNDYIELEIKNPGTIPDFSKIHKTALENNGLLLCKIIPNNEKESTNFRYFFPKIISFYARHYDDSTLEPAKKKEEGKNAKSAQLTVDAEKLRAIVTHGDSIQFEKFKTKSDFNNLFNEKNNSNISPAMLARHSPIQSIKNAISQESIDESTVIELDLSAIHQYPGIQKLIPYFETYLSLNGINRLTHQSEAMEVQLPQQQSSQYFRLKAGQSFAKFWSDQYQQYCYAITTGKYFSQRISPKNAQQVETLVEEVDFIIVPQQGDQEQPYTFILATPNSKHILKSSNYQAHLQLEIKHSMSDTPSSEEEDEEEKEEKEDGKQKQKIDDDTVEETKLNIKNQRPYVMFDAGHHPDYPSNFMVKKKLPGENLLQLLKSASLTPAQKSKIAHNILKKVNELHTTQRMVHLNLEPEHILVDENFDVHIIGKKYAINPTKQDDLTIEKKEVKFLPSLSIYSAPELFFMDKKDHPIDCKADYYSLGVILSLLFATPKKLEGFGKQPEDIHEDFRKWKGPTDKEHIHYHLMNLKKEDLTNYDEYRSICQPLLQVYTTNRSGSLDGYIGHLEANMKKIPKETTESHTEKKEPPEYVKNFADNVKIFLDKRNSTDGAEKEESTEETSTNYQIKDYIAAVLLFTELGEFSKYLPDIAVLNSVEEFELNSSVLSQHYHLINNVVTELAKKTSEATQMTSSNRSQSKCDYSATISSLLNGLAAFKKLTNTDDSSEIETNDDFVKECKEYILKDLIPNRGMRLRRNEAVNDLSLAKQRKTVTRVDKIWGAKKIKLKTKKLQDAVYDLSKTLKVETLCFYASTDKKTAITTYRNNSKKAMDEKLAGKSANHPITQKWCELCTYIYDKLFNTTYYTTKEENVITLFSERLKGNPSGIAGEKTVEKDCQIPSAAC